MKSSKIEESLLSEKSFIVNDDLMSMAICQGHRNEFGAHLIQVLKQKCLIMLTLRSQRQNPKGHSPNAFLMQLKLKIRTLTTLSKMNAEFWLRFLPRHRCRCLRNIRNHILNLD